MAKIKFGPDTMEDIGNSDLVKLSRELLDSVVQSTKILSEDIKMTPERLQEGRLVLGFLNAATGTMKTKLNYFRMTGVGAKVKAVKEMGKKL